MSVLISVLVAGYAELFILSAVIYLPKHKDLNYITNAMKHPLDLINKCKAWQSVYAISIVRDCWYRYSIL